MRIAGRDEFVLVGLDGKPGPCPRSAPAGAEARDRGVRVASTPASGGDWMARR